MKTDSGSEFCGSRGSRSPRSRIRIRAPVGASAVATEPPPIPEPMMTTSKSCMARPPQAFESTPRARARATAGSGSREDASEPGRAGSDGLALHLLVEAIQPDDAHDGRALEQHLIVRGDAQH